MEGPEFYRQESQRNVHVIFILIVYVLLMVTTHYGFSESPFDKTIVNIIQNEQIDSLSFKHMMAVFNAKEYEGKWVSRDQKTDKIFTHDSGKFTFNLQKRGNLQNPSYGVEFKINNGDYIDDGCLTIKTVVKVQDWKLKQKGQSIKAVRKNTRPLYAHYKFDKLMKTEEQKLINLSTLHFTFSPKGKDMLKVSIKLGLSEDQFQTLNLQIKGQDTKLFHYIAFAILLFFTSYLQFSAILELIGNILDGSESAFGYSFLTIMIATMWDAVICIIAFVCAFNNEENLLLFIIPAFLLCLLFSNFQLRFMLLIYQADRDNNNTREILCKFNLISYGSLVLIYPIILLTNFNFIFFILITLFFIPQIYTNALQGIRPNLFSPYYLKFLLSRFILLFYMKCFPWNVFELEPNYPLASLCFILVVLQITFLWLQKQYGPKYLIPSIFLPHIFDYSYTIEQDLTTKDECSICLNSLSSGFVNDASFEVQNKLMKTPCSHKYHRDCLIKWMQIKKQCPQCRKKLPPYE